MAKGNASAVIDIGSSLLTCDIAQAGREGPQELDYLEFPINLGYESFTHGRVSFQTLEEVARVMEGFIGTARQYGVEDEAIAVTATTALREASNAAYILDQLRIRTSFAVQVLEDGQEMALIFKEVMRRMELTGQDLDKPFMMAYIGTGSVGIAAVRGGVVAYARNVRVGSLKLSQMLGESGDRTPRFYHILEEYLSALTGMTREEIQAFRPGRFVVCGKEIELIAQLTHTEEVNGMLTIERRGLSALYDEIKTLTPAQAAARFHLRPEQGEVLLPSLAIYMTLADFTQSDKVLSPSVAMGDWLLYERLFPKEAKEWQRRFEDGIAASAWEMLRHYRGDAPHAAAVEAYSLQIFDSLRKVHGFSRRERRLLQTAAILHDIGKFVNSKYHDQYSCHLLMDSNLIDLTRSETALVANIARYHSGAVPSMSHAEWAALTPQERLTVSKLTAILRIADGLDRSHMQKFTDIEFKLQDSELLIIARSDRDTRLEEWAFGYKSEFFTEVFGMRCLLRKKGRE